MKLIFCRKPSLGSWLIRAFTWSPWSHVAIVESDGHVIESTMTHGGVRRRPLPDFLAEYSHVATVEWLVPDEAAALDFVRAQLGKPYDWRAIFGFIFHRDWADDRAWFCNELAEAGAQTGGLRRFRDGLARVTPRMSWEVL